MYVIPAALLLASQFKTYHFIFYSLKFDKNNIVWRYGND